MTSEELKEALLSQRPVIARIPSIGEIEYKCVSAIIYRRKADGGIDISAELTDRVARSVTIADPKTIFFKEDSQ